MGQYYLIVNLDKQEYLYPHTFNDGSKLMEFGQSAGGILLALTVLLSDGNGRGGGDIESENPLVGSWAGDRIVITGDYADGLKFLPENVDKRDLQDIANQHFTEGYRKAENVNLAFYAEEKFTDISEKVRQLLIDAGEYKL